MGMRADNMDIEKQTTPLSHCEINGSGEIGQWLEGEVEVTGTLFKDGRITPYFPLVSSRG